MITNHMIHVPENHVCALQEQKILLIMEPSLQSVHQIFVLTMWPLYFLSYYNLLSFFSIVNFFPLVLLWFSSDFQQLCYGISACLISLHLIDIPQLRVSTLLHSMPVIIFYFIWIFVNVSTVTCYILIHSLFVSCFYVFFSSDASFLCL